MDAVLIIGRWKPFAVERVRDGERPSSVIASFGFHRTTIYQWLNDPSTTPVHRDRGGVDHMTFHVAGV